MSTETPNTENELEYSLYNIGSDNEQDYVGPVMHSEKAKADKGGTEIRSQNPFVRFQATRDSSGETRVHPIYAGKYRLPVQIVGIDDVFGGNCSIIHCQFGDKRFKVFSPESYKQRKEKHIGATRDVQIAAISCGRAYEKDPAEPEKEDFITPEELAQFRKNGFAIINPLNKYSTIFDIQKELQRKREFVVMVVNNPFNTSESLELITHTTDTTSQLPKRFVSDFYVIGSILE
ncbi:MAG: hypothetical protein KKF56_04560 [Nanoarchaeota archaeon]|nr:hypothetical protein [Nanoarchaeota archaeon]